MLTLQCCRGSAAHLKQGTPLCLLLLNACSTSFTSLAGSIRQKDPLPGSSWERGTLTKYLNRSNGLKLSRLPVRSHLFRLRL